jgi:3-hydroxybutyryl-CoA dehydrogenase
MSQARRITIIGGGLMGAGIAQVFLAAGHDVTVFEPLAAVRDTVRARVAADLRLFDRDPALADTVQVADDLAAAVANAFFVTEAAPEKLELKQSLFAQLVQHAPASAILASNTSVIPIHLIAAGLSTAERIVGTHWWNPAALIPLVEVVQSNLTSSETVETTIHLLRSIGKAPAHVIKDTPGFVGNRLQHALWREAIAMVAEGVCDAATLDACVKNSFGLRLAVLGPLENADLVGLDLTLDIHKIMMPQLDCSSRPHPYLERKVADGALGFKTDGHGFRDWSADEMTALRARLAAHLLEAQRKCPVI